METYKTFKTTGNENEVQSFIDQYGDICVIVVIAGVEYAVSVYEDETEDERKSDFLSEYGSNDNSIKAIELMSTFIANDYSKEVIEEVINEVVEIELSKAKCNEITFNDFNKMNKFDNFITDCSKNQVIMRMTSEQFEEVIDLLKSNESVSILS